MLDLAVAVVAGGLIGLSLGALGGGGSILAVPVLVYALGQTPTQATTGSLVVVGVTALIGAVTAYRAGNVLLGRGVAFGLVGVGGAAVGAKGSALVSEAVLLAAFAILMLVVGGVMAVRQVRAHRADSMNFRESSRCDVGTCGRPESQDDVDFTGEQSGCQARKCCRDRLNGHPGVCVLHGQLQRGERRRHQRRHDANSCRYCEPQHLGGSAGRRDLGGLGGVHQLRSKQDEALAGRRESHKAASVALDEWDTQRRLEPLDPLGEG
ncbi:MAG: sulfite exporter TauE/SafE family protein [Actinomycetota bacterium]|nr:sulfite exporter TauE/SafE family protein [Actinomycetota bacterium]